MLVGSIMLILSLLLLGFEFPYITFGSTRLSGMAVLIGPMGLAGLGFGIAGPAANNACIDLMPDRVASITGVRGMFRTAGGAVTIAIVSLLLSNLGSMSLGFSIAFFSMSVIFLMALPLIFIMPRSADVAPAPSIAALDKEL